jgi:WD40 repeat protein
MLRQFQPHIECVFGLTVSPDAKVLCTCSQDGTAGLFEVESLESIARLEGHRDAVNGATFCEEHFLMTCSDDRTVRVWDIRQLQRGPVGMLGGFADGVNRALFLPKVSEGAHSRIISACDDGLVYVHDAATMNLIDKFLVAGNTVNDLVLCPGDVLVTCAEDCAVRSWRLQGAGGGGDDEEDGRMIMSFDEFDSAVNHIAQHNGWMFAAVAEHVFSFEFDPLTGIFGDGARTFSCHRDFVRGILFSPLTGTMLTISDDGSCVEWDMSSGEAIRQVQIHGSYVMAADMTSDGAVLITGDDLGVVKLWRLPFGE